MLRRWSIINPEFGVIISYTLTITPNTYNYTKHIQLHQTLTITPNTYNYTKYLQLHQTLG